MLSPLLLLPLLLPPLLPVCSVSWEMIEFRVEAVVESLKRHEDSVEFRLVPGSKVPLPGSKKMSELNPSGRVYPLRHVKREMQGSRLT